jgi:hypothetical protein
LLGQLCDLREASALCATATAHAAGHCYTDDVSPIRYANSFDQPDVVANVHAYRDPKTNLYHAADSCHQDTVCYGDRDAGTDLHALAHPGETRADLHIHPNTHARASIDVDTNANVDVDTGSDAIFYPHNGVDAYADRIA